MSEPRFPLCNKEILARLVHMFESSAVLTRLADALDALVALDLSRLNQDQLLDVLRGVERQRRRLATFDHALVAELDRRGSAGELAARDTRSLLRDALRLSPMEAKARYDAAVDLGPRYTVTGEPLGPIFPTVAAAQAEGAISTDHARVIRRAVDALPAEIALEHAAAVEERLVAEARRFDPTVLAVLSRRILAHLHPDGVLADDVAHERRRHATLTANRDGSGELHGHLTPSALTQWQAVLDPVAAPRPSDESGPDTRTPGQRLHDALADAAARLLNSDVLPPSGGTPATVLLSLTLNELETRTGLVTTAHGGSISVAEALRLAGEASVVPVVLDQGGVLAYGTDRRIASVGQRLALAARDKGCCFPGCDSPPSWCQVHHIIEWAEGGSTDLNNLCLLCGYHHREHQRRGWTIAMRSGQPHWIPPPWVDPEPTPVRNTIHDLIPG